MAYTADNLERFGAQNALYPSLGPFNKQLQACRRRSTIDGRPFILASRLIDWLRSPVDDPNASTNAGRILNEVYPRSDELDPKMRTRLLSFSDDSNSKCWLRIVTILLQMPAYLRSFAEIIKIFHELGISDLKLPIDKQDTNITRQLKNFVFTSQATTDFINEFDRLQWELVCDKAFDEDHIDGYPHPHLGMILPVTGKECTKQGGQGAIFMIEVPAECLPQTLSEKMRRKPYAKDDGSYHQFALKVLNDEKSYNEETRAYRALDKVEGIVQCFGYWSYAKSDGKKEYHLLLEWGSYDLSDFFRLYPPPTTTNQIRKFWKALLALPFALSRIHTMKAANDGHESIYLGWHGDIKPSNIVYCEETKRGWKICDPGFAKFVMRDDATYNRDRLPVINLKGGTHSYGGPERLDSPNISQLFDIWSLGCVLSEAASWVILGHRGVELYKLVRKSLNIPESDDEQTEAHCSSSESSDDEEGIGLDDPIQCIGSDRFYHGGTRDVSQTVVQWHTYLRESLRSKDRITEQILEVIEHHMLQKHAGDRLSAKKIYEQMRTIVEEAEKKDAASSCYKFPAYFAQAKKEEQAKEARDHKIILKKRHDASSNSKYKSKYFNNHAFDEATKKPLGAADYDDLQDQSPYETQTDSQWPTTFIRTASNLGPLDFDSRGDKVPYINYYDARRLLEEDGWLPGTLELVRNVDAGPSSPDPQRRLQLESTYDSREHGSVSRQHTSAGSVRKAGQALITRLESKSWLSRKSSRRDKGDSSQQIDAVPRKLSPGLDTPLPSINTHMKKPSVSEKWLANYYKDRDIVFLVDNGSSMVTHWLWARDLLSVLVAFLYGQDSNGIDLFFTSSKKKHGNYTEPKQFVDAMTKMAPKDSTPNETADQSAASGANFPSTRHHHHHHYHQPNSDTQSDAGSSASMAGAAADVDPNDIRKSLHVILESWSSRYRRKLTIIILTDGVWSSVISRKTVADKIKLYLQEKWDDKTMRKKLMDRFLSIQFIQFGNDARATRELTLMDREMFGNDGKPLPDIIDHEFAEKNIYKMLIGSLDPKVDGETSTVTGDDVATDLASTDPVYSPSPLSPSVSSPSGVGMMIRGSGSMFPETA